METALITAFIAAGAAVVAAVVSWFGAFQSRRTADRDHAWHRFTWSLRARPRSTEYDMSKRVLHDLAGLAWWSKADRSMARRALNRVIVRERTAHDEEEPRS